MASAEMIEEYSLSPMQHGMFFHSLREPGSGTDIEQIDCLIKEDIEAAILRNAWERAIERHAAMRTAFRCEVGRDPVQFVHRHVTLPWEEQDWRAIPASEQAERLRAFLSADRLRGFDLGEAPLLRLTLIRTGEAEYHVLWTFHHILLDGRSFPQVINEVFAFYESSLSGRSLEFPPSRQYRDYIDWLQSHQTPNAESYWREQLEGFPGPTPLALEKPATSSVLIKDRQGDRRAMLDESVTSALRDFAEANGLTLNTLVQGAWALLLGRYCGDDDVTFGVVRACRNSTVPGADEIVGLFINTLPMRVRMNGELPLLDWLKQLRSQWVGVRDYEHTQLVEVQKCSGLAAGSRLFDTILMFDNYELSARMRAQGGNWEKRWFRLYEQTGYPLTLTVYADTEICLQLEFDRNRFEAAAIEQMLGHLRALLEAMPQNSMQQLRDIPMLNEEEIRRLTVEWNDTRHEYPQKPVHQLFEAQVEHSPDAVAVVYNGEQLSYRELNSRANRLAHYLRSCGVGRNVFVGICLQRSLDMVIAVLGVLKSGGAYVPLDPGFPEERLAIILEDSKAGVLISQRELGSIFPAYPGTVVYVDDPALASQSFQNPASGVQHTDLAYVIFTSGSTGRPKGVQVEHRSLVNFLHSMSREPGLVAEDVVLAVTTLSFDIAGLELLLPLIMGAKVVVAARDVVVDGRSLAKLIESAGTTVMQATPATWRMLLEGGWPGRKCMKILCGGEALTAELAAELLPRCSSLWNVYGPTETTIWSTTCQVTAPENPIPIGRPIENTQLYVLDRYLRPVPVGVTGELFIAGDGVAQGYVNRPELTAERFLADPFSQRSGARMYRTGDLCRWRPDRMIECLGRNDNQVKIRGYRIELGEIESVLATHPQIMQAVVKVHERATADKQLVAYIVSKNGSAPRAEDLRSHMAERLPEYMVPSAYLVLSRFPLTPNGKVDRKALPAVPDMQAAAADKIWSPPQDEAECKVAEIWGTVLGVTNIGRDANFFDLGGHSLLMIRVRSTLEQVFEVEIPVIELFRNPTVRLLARYLSAPRSEPVVLTRSLEQIQAQKESARRRLQRRVGGL